MSEVILGIDPGTNITGYGIIQTTDNDGLKLLSMGVFNLKKIDTYEKKLAHIFNYSIELVKQYQPSCLVFEDAFYSQNVQVLLKLGRLQGLMMACAALYGLPSFNYSPRTIKLSITGYGNASKERVEAILASLFRLEGKASYLDASDALAVAVCHLRNRTRPLKELNNRKASKTRSWASFISANPHKVRRN